MRCGQDRGADAREHCEAAVVYAALEGVMERRRIVVEADGSVKPQQTVMFFQYFLET